MLNPLPRHSRPRRWQDGTCSLTDQISLVDRATVEAPVDEPGKPAQKILVRLGRPGWKNIVAAMETSLQKLFFPRLEQSIDEALNFVIGGGAYTAYV